MLQQMFELASARFNAAMQMFAPLIDSVVVGLSVAVTRESVVGNQRWRYVSIDLNRLEKR